MDAHAKQKNGCRIAARKISTDILILSMVAFFSALLIEGVLPGYVSSRVSFTKIFFVFFLASLLWISLEKSIADTKKETKKDTANHGRLMIIFLFFFFLITANSLLKFGFWMGFLLAGLATVAAYLFYFLFFQSQ